MRNIEHYSFSCKTQILIMKKYRFQEKYTGVQITVYHCRSVEMARSKFNNIVINPDNWIFLDEEPC